ncbi:hypothetical protein LCDVSa130R [Lymphocystis disease virus 3]|uniref:Uncharacterized protein n=1 Tax=Lymphocystis disease virus 3 TaxID=2560566 RepID=A0A1B2RW31_9VIRU|nr:hypothetical protein BZK12_gp130 [Lymphocystis disease virus Sa]AOC55214.1 hypothetical protein LCDVSa130R [Lymphocystis disease virus 3]
MLTQCISGSFSFQRINVNSLITTSQLTKYIILTLYSVLKN